MKTPKQMVDDLLWNPREWVPPIPRYPGLDDGEAPADWQSEYRLLETHHALETSILHAVIRELAKRLESK